MDVNTFFTLPATIEDPAVVCESPVEPHQSMAEFYWSLAASQPNLGADPLKPVAAAAAAGNTTWQPYVAPLTPPEPEHLFSSDSGQSTPALDYAALSPVSSSNNNSNNNNSSSSTPSKPTTKKLLRTSTRKPSVKDEQKTKRAPAPNSKEAKLLRAKNCHNLVEKKYRNRLNNNFELLLSTVMELRKQHGNGGADDMGFSMMEDDDNESLSSKGTATGKTDLNGDKTMSKSDVLRLARETVLDLERKNKALLREMERLKGVVETSSGSEAC